MSGSDRDDETRHLGAYGIAAALILSIIVVGGVAYSSGIESERRNQHPAEYSGYAKTQAQRSCVGMNGPALFECVYNEIEASQETARAEQDLDAQQGMKFWAALMFFAAMGTAAVTLLGVHYVRLTLNKNSELLSESAKATKAMRDANEIAMLAVKAQHRPDISITPKGQYIRMKEYPRQSKVINGEELTIAIFGEILVLNQGPAPITVIETYLTARVSTAQIWSENVFHAVKTGDEFTVANNLHIGEKRDSPWPIGFMRLDINNINEFKRSPQPVVGYIVYDDIIGVRRKKGFAFAPRSVIGTSHPWVVWGGNSYNFEKEISRQ